MGKVVAQGVKQEKKVMVHANGRIPVRMALDSGCYAIEHNFFRGLENPELMAGKQIAKVATVFAMKACLENLNMEDKLADPVIAAPHQLDQLAVARQCGVTVAPRTDSGSIGVLHDEAVAEEYKLVIKVCYSLPEAERCATYNSAPLLGIENKMGLLAKGRPADFIVERGTPAQLPIKLSCLEAICISGTPAQKKFFEKNRISCISGLSWSLQFLAGYNLFKKEQTGNCFKSSYRFGSSY